MKNLRTVPVWVLLCLCFAGCANKESGRPLTAEQSAAKSRLEEQMKEAARTGGVIDIV